MSRWPSRITPQQLRFAELYATTDLSLTAAFRLAYPPRNAGRKPATERRAASRLARNLRVKQAIELAIPPDPERMRREALITLWRVDQGELDPRLGDHARARLREANRMLREAEQGPERRRRRKAWRMFSQAVSQIYQGRCHAGPPLSPAERTELIFAHYAPFAPPGPIEVSAPTLPVEPDVAEIEELVRTQQLARGTRPAPALPAEVPCPQPGCFPQSVPSGSGDESIAAVTALRAIATGTPPPPTGTWTLEIIPGFFPPKRRRVWKPIDNSNETPRNGGDQ
jgi:hypothetical protein